MNTTQRENLIRRVNEIDGLSNDERSALIGLLRETKSYGLVWENKVEAVEERLRDELPILTEVPERAIISDDKNAPNHIIIEGDNLEALATLAYTHEGKIDVIYIDPPYNTGNKDFVYNDSFVDKEDSFRHSKWLSFMEKRLRIAKKLLSDKGVIFISIDDNEQANLKLLCDEVIGSMNFVTTLHVEMSATQGMKVKAAKQGNIVKNGEYILIYKMNGDKNVWYRPLLDPVKYDNHYNSFLLDEGNCYSEHALTSVVSRDKDIMDELRLLKILDSRGKLSYKQISTAYERSPKFRDWVNSNADRICRAHDSIDVDENIKQGMEVGKIYLYENDERNYFITKTTDGDIFQRILLKDKLSIADDFYRTFGPTKIRGDWWASFYLDMGNVSKEGKVDYKNGKKPIRLIQQIVQFASESNSIILDFFAGSGTTLHATVNANTEDNGKRKCILVQCSEKGNNICENTTYPRAKNVLLENHSNSLRYYKTGFVSRERTPQNMRKLVLLATDMLCIKEDLYDEKPMFGEQETYKNVFRFFDNGKKQMLIIYREEAIDQIVDIIRDMEVAEPILVYVFSTSEDPWEGSFEDVSDKVKLCALPMAIYNTYKRVLPKKRDEIINQNEEGGDE